MVGLPWEQHVTFLDDRAALARSRTGCATGSGRAPAIPRSSATRSATRSRPRSCAGTAAAAVERFLERLYCAAKEEDPGGLVTYVNYPSTEYLELPFLDFVTFNVYLESRQPLEAYLARLQNLAGDRPLRHGRDRAGQPPPRPRRAGRACCDWQVETAFAAGCAGAFVFSLDRRVAPRRARHRGLGLRPDRRATGDRSPRWHAVRAAFARMPPVAPAPTGPGSRSSCAPTTAGARSRDCLDGLLKLDYPDFEVIVVDDGSTDATAAIAARVRRTG